MAADPRRLRRRLDHPRRRPLARPGRPAAERRPGVGVLRRRGLTGHPVVRGGGRPAGVPQFLGVAALRRERHHARPPRRPRRRRRRHRPAGPDHHARPGRRAPAAVRSRPDGRAAVGLHHRGPRRGGPPCDLRARGGGDGPARHRGRRAAPRRPGRSLHRPRLDGRQPRRRDAALGPAVGGRHLLRRGHGGRGRGPRRRPRRRAHRAGHRRPARRRRLGGRQLRHPLRGPRRRAHRGGGGVHRFRPGRLVHPGGQRRAAGRGGRHPATPDFPRPAAGRHPPQPGEARGRGAAREAAPGGRAAPVPRPRRPGRAHRRGPDQRPAPGRPVHLPGALAAAP